MSRVPLLRLLFHLAAAAASGTVHAAPAAVPAAAVPSQDAGLGALLDKSGGKFTPALRDAWLAAAKARALEQLAAAGQTLPDDFLAWVDADPQLRASVYAGRRDAANVLRLLRSLEIDLGPEVVRNDATQLCLAMAIVHAAQGAQADLKLRPRLQLAIPGDPRIPVDVNDPARPHDRDDRIIQFLNSRKIEEDVVVGHKEEPPPLRYDERGIAIPPAKNAKAVKVPITEKRVRTLQAADVLASRELQLQFNDWMKECGYDTRIDCGDRVVHWQSKDAVRAERKQINEAFLLFRTAYENKGLLPKARDAAPTPAESVAWLLRNDRYRFDAPTGKQQPWPKFPLNAPWPLLTLLAADDQPLREREERWQAFRDRGEMRTYGEYIGPIAQQFDMQSARRLAPFAFYYGTYQMMAKDGGVCGTMANMGVRTYKSLGIPSCTAGQPGHCALIMFQHDAKTGLYECKGGQFATGGPEKTNPHTPWVFGDSDKRVPMVYYQSIAWAVNFGMAGYLDTTVACRIIDAMTDVDRKRHGSALLESAVPLNPYNLLLAETGQRLLATPAAQLSLCRCLEAAVAAVEKPGCPHDALYLRTIRHGMYQALANLPLPQEPGEIRAILDALRAMDCDSAATLVPYRVAAAGADTVAAEVATEFTAHLKGTRGEAEARVLADAIDLVGKRLAKNQRKAWVRPMAESALGMEYMLTDKNKITADPAVALVAKLAGQAQQPETQRLQSLLDQLAAEFRVSVAAPRDPKTRAAYAKRIRSVAGQIKDPAQARQWLDALSRAIAGKESFSGAKGKQHADPCAATIAELLAGLPAS